MTLTHTKTKKPKIRLLNTYITDLKRMDVHVGIKQSEQDIRLYTRTYAKGYVFFQGHRLDASFILFKSGNIQVCNVSGEGSEEFVTALNAYFDTRGYLPMIRQFYLYLYPLAAPCLAGTMIYYFCSQRYWYVLLAFIIMAIVRYMYEFARNVF